MPVPDKFKNKLTIIALDDAAKKLGDDAEDPDMMESDSDKLEDKVEDCQCPKCGYKGTEDEFKMEM